MAKVTAATPLMHAAAKFLMRFMAWMSRSPMSPMAPSMRMPMPAPKYPPYTPTKN